MILYVTFLCEIYEEGQDKFFSDASDGYLRGEWLYFSKLISHLLFDFLSILSTFCFFVPSSCYFIVVYYL